MNPSVTASEWDESPSVPELALNDTGAVFESFFERSVDAVWLLDQQAGVFVDCNQAAVELIGAENKQQLMRTRPEDLSPPLQSDGTPSAEKSVCRRLRAWRESSCAIRISRSSPSSPKNSGYICSSR